MGPGPRGPGNRARGPQGRRLARASMGPGPRGPGNVRTYQERNCWPLQWGRDRAVPEMVVPPCFAALLRFNGAGTARSRKLASNQAGCRSTASMGPGPRGPGNEAGRTRQNRRKSASMGPGPRGPGNRLTTTMGHPGWPPRHRFNGAGTARSRKYAAGTMHDCDIASMGPGPRGPGNVQPGTRLATRSRASMGPGPRGPGNAPRPWTLHIAIPASMGPGPRGPGNGDTGASPAPKKASMGPGPRGPGNDGELPSRWRCTGFNGAGTARSRKSAASTRRWAILLQWGRDRAVPEMLYVAADDGSASVLQWGRDRAVPEISSEGL